MFDSITNIRKLENYGIRNTQLNWLLWGASSICLL